MDDSFLNWQIVTLEYPCQNWTQPEVARLFSRMVALKLEGYQTVHHKPILPVDGTDFVAAHHLVCEKISGELQPVM